MLLNLNFHFLLQIRDSFSVSFVSSAYIWSGSSFDKNYSRSTLSSY